MDWRRWASIARLPIRKMSCLNGSKKLLMQKILQIRIVGGCIDFPHKVRFSAGIGPAHFPAETTRPLGPRLSAIFTRNKEFHFHHNTKNNSWKFVVNYMIIRVKKKTLWFPQVFEDERGLTGGEVTLSFSVASLNESFMQFLVVLYPSVQTTRCRSTGRVWKIGKRQGELIIGLNWPHDC